MAMSSYPAHPRHPFYSFVKEQIALAPNNASAWNYLRGILDYARMPYSTQAAFAELYVVETVEAGTGDVVDLENPPPSQGAELPCPAALEFMADIHEARGKEGVPEAVKFWSALAHTHDTIRKRYVADVRRTAHRLSSSRGQVLGISHTGRNCECRDSLKLQRLVSSRRK